MKMLIVVCEHCDNLREIKHGMLTGAGFCRHCQRNSMRAFVIDWPHWEEHFAKTDYPSI